MKTFAELTDAELDALHRRQRRRGARAWSTRSAASTPRSPTTWSWARCPRPGRAAFALKVHGSDLSYTVLPDLDRFGPYARGGRSRPPPASSSARGHTAERLRQAVDDPGLTRKTRLGPPGVDIELFAPPAGGGRRGRRERWPRACGRLSRDPARQAPGPRSAAQPPPRSSWFAEAEGPRVLFVGKLIVSKGVDLLLAAWPLVAPRRNPRRAAADRRLRRATRRRRERLVDALAAGDLDAAREIAAARPGARGRAEAGRCASSAPSSTRPPAGYADAARAAAGSVALRRPARARRGRGAGARRRRAGLPEHLPGGVRDGRRRGARPRACCRSPPPTRGCARSARALAGRAAAELARAAVRSSSTPDAVDGDRRSV